MDMMCGRLLGFKQKMFLTWNSKQSVWEMDVWGKQTIRKIKIWFNIYLIANHCNHLYQWIAIRGGSHQLVTPPTRRGRRVRSSAVLRVGKDPQHRRSKFFWAGYHLQVLSKGGKSAPKNAKHKLVMLRCV